MLNRRDIDVREVGARLAALALGEAAGRVPDMAGPEIRTVEDLARTYLTAVRKGRPIISMRLPGRVCRAYRAGGHLAPDRAVAPSASSSISVSSWPRARCPTTTPSAITPGECPVRRRDDAAPRRCSGS
jgi:hypothetical protein